MKYFRNEFRQLARQPGFSLMEVLIGIAIFAIGMLALASLQGALARSMAEAKVRTEAVNIAEEIIEAQRGFSQIETAAGVFAYGDIRSSNDLDNPWTDNPMVISRNYVNYQAEQTVTDYYYDLATDAFIANPDPLPVGSTHPDYKTVSVVVSWDDDREFVIDEGRQTTGGLGGGSIQVSQTISSVAVVAAIRIAAESGDPLESPPVNYTPGVNPDVVALSLGDSKFKESLLPEPDVLRRDELVQTTFDVITYSADGGGNQFLRREEFAAVSCECTLRAASAAYPARRPFIWAGDEYAAGHFVTKPYGESSNNKNSFLCDSCCRDHHDGGDKQDGDSDDAYSNVYGPFKSDGEYLNSGQARKISDHKHYEEDSVTIAAVGKTYLEACRLVRVDGFFRVAQDFRREDQYVFPADFLDGDDAENITYSNHVTGAAVAYRDNVVNDYPTNSPPCIGIPQPPIDGNPTCVAVPTMQGSYPAAIASGQLPTWTALQTGVMDTQQLRSRGIYIDYLSNDLRLFMTQCFDGSGVLKNDCCIRDAVVATSCTADDLYIDRTPTANKLETLPFYEVQLTKLDSWEQTQRAPLTIELTSEAIEDANAHDRGNASQYVPKNDSSVILGATVVTATSHRGNIGFTDTMAIDPEFDNQLKQANLQVQSLDASGNGSTATGSPIIRLEGQFSAYVTGVQISVAGGGDAHCGLKSGGYWCNVASGAVAPTIMVYGYEDTLVEDLDPPDTLVARCAVSNSLIWLSSNIPADDTNATFSLLDSSGAIQTEETAYDIHIEVCPSGGV